MFHPKHFEAQILVVWDNLHFSLWLCCFALFSLLLLWGTCSWSCVFAQWVCAVRAPSPCAADRTSWPALARAHLAAPACLPECQHQQLCLVAPHEELGDLSVASLPPWYSLHTNVMWHFFWNYLLMEGCGGTATRPRKSNLETWSKTITFPLRAAITRHILWTLWPWSSTGFPFSTEQHIIALWEELLHTYRGLCAWEVIRNQHGSGSRGLRDC